jgi:hypothetical protein
MTATATADPTVIYQRHPSVRCLRAMAFAPYPDVPAALGDPAFAVPPPDETAMLVFDGRSVFELNLVSAFVWDLLDGTRALDDVVSAVVRRFGVERPTACCDVLQLSESLAQQTLVVVCPPQRVHRV